MEGSRVFEIEFVISGFGFADDDEKDQKIIPRGIVQFANIGTVCWMTFNCQYACGASVVALVHSLFLINS